MESIVSTRVLAADGSVAPRIVAWSGATIAAIDDVASRSAALDARDLLVLPGMVDIHGDAFERQIMPRPGVAFDMDIALAETDRQLLANGITTAFHAITYSFEPGLRGAGTVRAFMAAMERLRPALGCDTRIHLRHETYNVDAVEEILGWIAAGQVDLLAFNDHTAALVEKARAGMSMARYVERTGLDPAAFARMVVAAGERAGEIPAANARLAEAARRRGIALASHDDETPAMRAAYRALGCEICEFPKTSATAAAARENGEASVLGAPNVVRGGSQSGGIDAADAIRDGLCDVLTSDYYYPSMMQAALRLVAAGSATIADAWSLVASAPAIAARLVDRGRLAPGLRADIVVVDDSDPRLPRAVAVIVGGRLAILDASRIRYAS